MLYYHLENLKAFAIVSQKSIDMHNVKIEKHFYKKPMELFDNLAYAIKWVKQVIS